MTDKASEQTTFPCELWLVSKNNWPQKLTVVGETSRSWITGPAWDQHKWSKKAFRVISSEEGERFQWAKRNEYLIGQAIQRADLPYETLKQIADLIGYEEVKR